MGLVPDSLFPLDLFLVVLLYVPVAVPFRVGLQLGLAVADLPRSFARDVMLITHQRHMVDQDHDSQRFVFLVRTQLFPHPLL